MKTQPAFHGFAPEAFGFFRQLARPNRARNNSKPWFDRHRAVYDAHVVGALKALFEESAEGVTCGFAAYDGRDSALAPRVALGGLRAQRRAHFPRPVSVVCFGLPGKVDGEDKPCGN